MKATIRSTERKTGQVVTKEITEPFKQIKIGSGESCLDFELFPEGSASINFGTNVQARVDGGPFKYDQVRAGNTREYDMLHPRSKYSSVIVTIDTLDKPYVPPYINPELELLDL